MRKFVVPFKWFAEVTVTNGESIGLSEGEVKHIAISKEVEQFQRELETMEPNDMAHIMAPDEFSEVKEVKNEV